MHKKEGGITMMKQYCMGCMKPLDWDGHCHHCDFEHSRYQPDIYHLQPGTMINNGNYLIGRVLGNGGFGITYIGLDTKLLDVVAIKEYYPVGLVERNASKGGNNDVLAHKGEEGELYQKGLNSFLHEARILAKFEKTEGIVRIRNYFEENKTAYMVMEYIDGISIRDYVQQYGAIEGEKALSLTKGIFEALQGMHEEKIIHRDISPDNLLIQPDGKLVLIDFGSARAENMLDQKTRTAMYKPGFSALELYSSKSKQGPVTDVYGLAATMYFMLTETTPNPAPERVLVDELPSIANRDDIRLKSKQKEAIMRGLSIQIEERFANVKAFALALYGEVRKGETEENSFFEEKLSNISPVKKSSILTRRSLQREVRRREKSTEKKKIIISIFIGTMFVILCAAVLIMGQMKGVKRGTKNQKTENQKTENQKKENQKTENYNSTEKPIEVQQVEKPKSEEQKTIKAKNEKSQKHNNSTASDKKKNTSKNKSSKKKTRTSEKSNSKKTRTSEKSSSKKKKSTSKKKNSKKKKNVVADIEKLLD